MAEAVGLASGVLAIATVTLKSTAKLFELVKSFQHHPTRVQELSDELASLQDILASLSETIGNLADVDFSSLKLPLQRCGSAVADFERELLKCSVHAGKDRTSFRDWAKLRYMGEDLDGFRRLLATYKATINIALTDATLCVYTPSTAHNDNADSHGPYLEGGPLLQLRTSKTTTISLIRLEPILKTVLRAWTTSFSESLARMSRFLRENHKKLR